LVPASTVEVTNLSPAPGDRVDEDTILVADITYRIGVFERKPSKFFIAPQFRSASDPNMTFNSLRHTKRGRHLKADSGQVHLKYKIRREWVSGRLAKPVKFTFLIIQVTKSHEENPIAESDEYEYEAH
jgi:hypothetical protein